MMADMNARKRFVNLVGLFAVAVLVFEGMSAAYEHGDFVPMSRRGQYHSMRTPWHDQLGRHCPRFGVNTEIVMPLPKPTGYSGGDSYKITLQFGREKYGTPWLLVVGVKGPEVPMLDVHLRYAGGELLGVTAKVITMSERYLKEHPSIRSEFWNVTSWPKHILVRYEWEENFELDVAGGLFVLFGSGFVLTLFMAIHILQSSKEKVARFIKENVVEPGVAVDAPKAD